MSRRVATLRAGPSGVTPHHPRAYRDVRLSVLISVICTALPALGDDAELQQLVREALEARPELHQAQAQTRAAKERVGQAETWSDPTLEVGVQNDGFTRWNVGRMEMSWVSFMARQTIPFPGKTKLRGDVVRADVTLSELAAERLRLSTIAEVRRAYLELQLLRERKALLLELIALNQRLVDAARVRAETGVGSQAELVRAQVELARAQQRRFLLDADIHGEEEALNQLRQKPLHTTIATPPLAKEGLPELLDEEALIALARERSPELLGARAGIVRAEASMALARRTPWPDFSVGAGVMVRGPLEPMWQVTLGVPVPVFSAMTQSRSAAEANAMREASSRGVDAVEQKLRLLARHRIESLRAYTALWRSTQEGLIQQLDGAAESTLAQFAVGKAELRDVLELTTLRLTETEAALQVLADAQRLVIEQDELSPAPASAPSPSMTAPTTTRVPAASSSSGGM